MANISPEVITKLELLKIGNLPLNTSLDIKIEALIGGYEMYVAHLKKPV